MTHKKFHVWSNENLVHTSDEVVVWLADPAVGKGSATPD